MLRATLSRRARVVLAAAGLAIAAASIAQPMSRPAAPAYKAGSGPDELWEVTTKMEVAGMPMAMPAQTHPMCLRKDRKPADSVPKQGSNCAMTDLNTVGAKTTFKMVCTGETPVTATGEVTHRADAYDGTMRMTMNHRGQAMEMTQTYGGKKVGACTLL